MLNFWSVFKFKSSVQHISAPFSIAKERGRLANVIESKTTGNPRMRLTHPIRSSSRSQQLYPASCILAYTEHLNLSLAPDFRHSAALGSTLADELQPPARD